MDSIFLQLGVVIIASAILGIVARLFKQPILLAYITAGILLGGGGLNLMPATVETEDIAKVGIIFLLFLIGLELNVGQIKRVGRVVIMAGLLQMAVVAVMAAGLPLLLGYSWPTAVFLGLAAAFSSTAVVLKRLVDRHELASLYGRVSVGILLLQDVVALLALILIGGTGTGDLGPASSLFFLGKGALFLGGTWLVTKYLLGPVFYHIAKSTELLFLTSVAWAFLFAIVSDFLGFSKEIGAFVAGLSLATLPYNLEIIGRVKPLKDFFLVMFFVVLGLEVSAPVIIHNLPLIAGLSVIVLLVKTFVTSLVMVRHGYPKRPSYLTGAGLGQMSEFSLLVVLLGVAAGHVDESVIGITAALLVITIVLNTYWVRLHPYIYPVFVKPLGWFGGRVKSRELRYRPDQPANHILLFGANRTGSAILKALARHGGQVLAVDHNPDVIRRLQRRGIESVYGDIDDHELLAELGLSDARMVVSTVPSLPANLYLIRHARAHNPEALVVTTAEQVESALAMYEAGADYVIVPHLLSGEQTAQMLEGAEARLATRRALRRKRAAHIRHLQVRRSELVA